MFGGAPINFIDYSQYTSDTVSSLSTTEYDELFSDRFIDEHTRA